MPTISAAWLGIGHCAPFSYEIDVLFSWAPSCFPSSSVLSVSIPLTQASFPPRPHPVDLFHSSR